MLELGRPLTLTWLEDGETVGVSAPVDIWLGQVVVALPLDIRTTIMDAVVAEVNRLNEIQEVDLEELGLEIEDDQEEE